MSETLPKVTVIILSWNRKKDMEDCLLSVEKIDYPNFAVIVVDNASTDGSQMFLKENFPHITLIQNNENLGFAKGNNIGIQQALKHDADYVFLLNNDAIVEPDVLEALVDVAKSDPLVGMVGSKICYYDSPTIIQAAGGKVDLKTGNTELVGYNEKDMGQHDGEHEVDFTSGVAMLVKRSVIEKVGMFDEKFFAYYEETDWCIRARKYGFKCLYTSKTKVYHKELATKTTTPNIQRLYYLTRNRFYFMKKNAPKNSYPSFLRWYFFKIFPREIGRRIFRDKSLLAFFAYLRGVRDGIVWR